MTVTDDAALFGAVTEMVGEAKQLRTELTTVARAGRRNRRMIWLTVTSVIFDLLLSIGLAWGITETRDAAAKARSALVSRQTACEANNKRITIQRQVWDAFFAQEPLPSQTADAKLERQAVLRNAVAGAYILTDCEAVK